MILNETPIRTSKNFGINNSEMLFFKVPKKLGEFRNRSVFVNGEKKILLVAENDEDSNRLNDLYEDGKILVSELTKNDFKLQYGISEEITTECQTNPNQPLRIVAKEGATGSEVNIDFLFDSENKDLQDAIEIYAEKDSSLTVTINYIPKAVNDEFLEVDKVEQKNIVLNSISNSDDLYYHNGIVKVCGLENSNIKVTIVNLLNSSSTNFMSFENKLLDNARLDFNIVDFGGKHSITNYYADLFGNSSNNNLKTIYLGNEKQFFDLNYIAHCRGTKSNIDIEVQGALKDEATKHFKGTIDFKKGCKKSVGNENENCLLLSDKAKSIALPVLLCSEEDVEGNHSSSSGKADSKELFYLMTRGFSEKDAMKLLVRANFSKIIDNSLNRETKELVDCVIENKL